MSFTTELIVGGIVLYGLESLTWGAFGYVLLRYLGLNEKYWYWDWLLIFVFFAMNEFWLSTIMQNLDISFGNQEALALIDNDIEGFFGMDYADLLIGGVEIFFGYWLARLMFNKIIQRAIKL